MRLSKANAGAIVLFGVLVGFLSFSGPDTGPSKGAPKINQCVEGQHKVYDGKCKDSETRSGKCTTRYEQTPQSYWCCCDNGYEPAGSSGADDGESTDDKDDGCCG